MNEERKEKKEERRYDLDVCPKAQTLKETDVHLSDQQFQTQRMIRASTVNLHTLSANPPEESPVHHW